jgi:peptidyl-prolyl cis-trans isomerase A (cyclophilin A)
MRNFLSGALVLICGALVSCGNGNNASLPNVSEIEIDQVKYGQKTIFKLMGLNLNQDFNVSVSNCEGLALLPNGSDTEKYLTCTPSAVGPAMMVAKSIDGVQMLIKNFEVPNPQVKISTNFGDLTVELYPAVAPITVNNYLNYVNAKFYSNTLMHRIIPQFVVQGGWLTTTVGEQTGAGNPIVLESNNGLKNTRGSIAMARTSAPNSASTQFYFNLVDNSKLDYQSESSPGYAVFGQILEGLNVIDIMAQISTATLYGLANFPTSNVIVKSIVQTK